MITSQSNSHQKCSILLVDDDRLILSTMTTGLTRSGYQVSSAESVDEAEAWLSKGNLPDLVIIDVNMPERSGLELPQHLHSLGNIPFILLTARSEREVIILANQLGAMGYLVKPIEIVQLIPAIETAMSRAGDIKNLKTTQDQLQTALDADRSVSIAVGIVMDKYQINYDDAFSKMRNTARSRQIKLIDMAYSIINAPQSLSLD